MKMRNCCFDKMHVFRNEKDFPKHRVMMAGDFYLLYRRRAGGGAVDRRTFRTAVVAMNRAIADRLLEGKTVVMPEGFGEFTPAIVDAVMTFSSGRHFIRTGCDWQKLKRMKEAGEWKPGDPQPLKPLPASGYIYRIAYVPSQVHRFRIWQRNYTFRPCRTTSRAFRKIAEEERPFARKPYELKRRTGRRLLEELQ